MDKKIVQNGLKIVEMNIKNSSNLDIIKIEPQINQNQIVHDIGYKGLQQVYLYYVQIYGGLFTNIAVEFQRIRTKIRC